MQHKMQHEKKETLISQGFQSGSGGIRTHVPLRTTAFRVQLVATSSIRFRINVLKYFQIFSKFSFVSNLLAFQLFSFGCLG